MAKYSHTSMWFSILYVKVQDFHISKLCFSVLYPTVYQNLIKRRGQCVHLDFLEILGEFFVTFS